MLVIVPPPKIAQPQHRLQLGSLGLIQQPSWSVRWAGLGCHPHLLPGGPLCPLPSSSNPCKTKKDYSWVPNALWEVFDSSLKPDTKLNILEYFLSLLSVLIISDALSGGPQARIYRELLLKVVAPSASCLTSEPDFLGSLDPPKATDLSPSDGSEPEEITLVRDLRYLLHLHASNPK